MKHFFKILLTAILTLFVSCKSTPDEASYSVKGLVTENPNYSDLEPYLEKEFMFIVNLKTNRLTVLKKGKAIDQWNIATGDVSGGNHEGIAKHTPTGLFTLNELIHCPKWMPFDVKDDNGVVPDLWEDKVAIFEKHPNVYGPCGSSNPLGSVFLWFYEDYGMHGNSDESVLRRSNPSDRAVSGGCIRNPNKLAEKLFMTMIRKYKKGSQRFKDFQAKVRENKRKPNGEKEELILDIRDLEIAVLIGHWQADPTARNSR
jgi:hypothetical protein